jgi:hypothetical protein
MLLTQCLLTTIPSVVINQPESEYKYMNLIFPIAGRSLEIYYQKWISLQPTLDLLPSFSVNWT